MTKLSTLLAEDRFIKNEVSPFVMVTRNAVSGDLEVLETNASGEIPVSTTGGSTSIVGFARNDYSTTNILNSGYTQIIASTSDNASKISIFDSSGYTNILAVGGAGAEVDSLYIPPGGVECELTIPSGSRISLKALEVATVNLGQIVINLIG